MNKNEMTVLRRSLCAISTSGEDTIRMAGCLNFLSQKIQEADRREKIENQMRAEAAKKPAKDMPVKETETE